MGAACEGGARAGPPQVADGASAVARGLAAVPSSVVLPILPGVRPVLPKSLPGLLGVLLQAVPSVLRLLLILQEIPDLEAAVIAGRQATSATTDDDRREVAVWKGLGRCAPTKGQAKGVARPQVEPDVEVVALTVGQTGAAPSAACATPRGAEVATRRPVRGAPSSSSRPAMVGAMATGGFAPVRGGHLDPYLCEWWGGTPIRIATDLE